MLIEVFAILAFIGVLILSITNFINYNDVWSLRQDVNSKDDRISNLSSDIDYMKRDIAYLQALPKIQEYAALVKKHHSQYYDRVEFYFSGGEEVESFPVSEISQKLTSAKALLEANCPKKCKRK